MSVLFTFAKALLFEWKDLSIKQLTDRGISMEAAFYYERLALWPSLLLMLATFKWEYAQAILGNRLFLGAFVFNLLFWIIQEYIGFYLVDGVQNLGFLSVFRMAMKLPIYAAIAWAINGEAPSGLMAIALAVLSMAMFFRPKASNPSGSLFRKGLIATAAVSLLSIVVSAVNVALGRFLFLNIHSVLFLVGLFSASSCLSIYIFFIFRKKPSLGKIEGNKNLRILAYSIPTLWFLGSIPEGYALASIPIFAVVAISSVDFLINVTSDLRNKRVGWNRRTAAFAFLVLIGVALASAAAA